jgi:poly(hydroxyalkanoate) granule-associated protein
MKRTKRNDRLAAVRKLGALAMAGVEDARDTAAIRVGEARAKAIDTVNQLERAFETRMTRAMSRLGVPTAREVRALAREVATLKASVQRLSRTRARA